MPGKSYIAVLITLPPTSAYVLASASVLQKLDLLNLPVHPRILTMAQQSSVRLPRGTVISQMIHEDVMTNSDGTVNRKEHDSGKHSSSFILPLFHSIKWQLLSKSL